MLATRLHDPVKNRIISPNSKVNIICPAQVLSRANTGTYWSRIKKWALISSAGAGKHLGGQSVSALLAKVPIVIVAVITDALVTNSCIHGLEEAALAEHWPNQTIARLPIFCTHHQAALSQRVGILCIDGLVSGLVRICNASSSSRFKDHFGRALEVFAGSIQRRTVIHVDPSWRAENARILETCSADLSQRDVSDLLDFFNVPWRSIGLAHHCTPGCCSSQDVYMKISGMFSV